MGRLALVAAVVCLGGCGGGSEGTTTTTRPAPEPARTAAADDVAAVERALPAAQSTLTGCADQAVDSPEPVSLSQCDPDRVLEGALGAIESLLGKRSPADCAAAMKRETRIGARHAALIKRVTATAFVSRGQWRSRAARNASLTRQHRRTLAGVKTACSF